MKKILSIALILVLLFSFAACNNPQTPTKPAVPTNVKISDSGLITWDAVENAVGYVVTINGQNNSATTNSYQVASVEKTFTYSIMTIGKDYIMSDPTEMFTFEGKGPVVPDIDLSGVTVAIEGGTEIRSGQTLSLKAIVGGTDDKTVTWKVTKGADVVTVDQNGLVTAKEVDGDVIVEVEARSNANDKKFATKVLTVVAKSVLTQDMLDALRASRLACDGFVTIDVYTTGLFPKLERTYSVIIKTRMDGEHWYAEYDNTTGISNRLYCANYNGLAALVGLSYENTELYQPMLDDYGHTISWSESGYYNNFNTSAKLTVSDFTFNESTWRYEYTGADSSLSARMIASANPYDFKVKGFSLIINGDDITGIYAESDDDYSIVAGYRCIQKMTVALTVDEEMEVPAIEKYSHEDLHDSLNTAIANMHALTSYTTDVKISNYSIYTSSQTLEGFVETVTSDVCYFVPYKVSFAQDKTEIHTPSPQDAYAYRKIDDTLYNSCYLNDNGKMVASRAFTNGFENAKPTFAFAGEIFRTYWKDDATGEEIYMVDSTMAQVATTMYKGIGNDVALYGIFASDRIALWEYDVDATYVTVKDGYITKISFWYDMYYMYGYVDISFADFNSAQIPEEVSFDGYEARQVPTQWNQLVTEVTDEEENSSFISVDEYLSNLLGADVAVPFFGDALGDTYGFVMDTVHISSDSQAHKAALFYYDVPLDNDYSIESSLDKIEAYLLNLGFVKNPRGEFHKDNIWVSTVDQDLDLIIYVWTA